jgi:hypothetical protein
VYGSEIDFMGYKAGPGRQKILLQGSQVDSSFPHLGELLTDRA